MKINSISFNYFTLSALFQFFTRLLVLIERIGADKLKVEAQVDNLLRPALAKLEKVYQRDSKSQLTKSIAEIDKEMDDTTVAMLGIVKVMLKSDDKDEAKSAENLEFVFDDFKGLTKNSRAVQSAKTAKLISILKGKNAADAEKVGLGKWIAKLERLNGEMVSIMDERVSEKAEKFKLDSAEVKKGAISAYRMFCSQVGVNVATEGSADYEEFIRNLNIIIGEFGAGSGKTTTPSGDGTPTEPVEPTTPGGSGSADDKYPNARLWDGTASATDSKVGEIFYIVIDGVKEYYMLLARHQAGNVMPGTDDSVWERVE